MVCVRCLKDNARKVAKAPDGSGAWEVYYCDNCNYVWRSSEEEEITVIEKREPAFQLDKVNTDELLCMLGIPPLKK
ncbi:MAG: non-oxidative hydroxyarylic acid decarboxylases subunit D [Ruminiclostridium sp.]